MVTIEECADRAEESSDEREGSRQQAKGEARGQSLVLDWLGVWLCNQAAGGEEI